MLFSSNAFVLAFLPVAVAGFFVVGAYSHYGALAFLVAASLVFYGWTDPIYLAVLLPSIVFNYLCGIAITRARNPAARWLTTAAILINLVCLGYFKYAAFAVENLNWLLGARLTVADAGLPLGISFFTFTQIAFLADAYARRASEYRFVHYALFVTYFPHLIAGPILHHKEMIPQFEKQAVTRFDWQNFAAGTTIFAIGLFKKVIIADTFAIYADNAFAQASSVNLGLLDAWVGTLSFAFQIYFDFSAYCDMAVGMSLIFGIRLPLNFFSPYKSASIIDFWRTWHMTLSRFLCDYVYIPLGGNRRGAVRRYVNLLLTMLIGGLWHGANWNFVIWGGLHGLFIVINHAWRRVAAPALRLPHVVSVGITFGAVCFAWVFFRSETTAKAISIINGMIGLNGLVIPHNYRGWFGPLADSMAAMGVAFGTTPAFGGLKQVAILALGFAIIWLLPNVAEIFARYRPVLDPEGFAIRESTLYWRPRLYWAAGAAAAMFVSVVSIADYKPFIYFQF